MKAPAVEIAKRQQAGDGTVTLSTGVRVRLRPIPPGTMQEALRSIKHPTVPTWINPDKNREEENPNDPEYLDALVEYSHQRSQVIEEVAFMFGLELVDAVPEPGDLDRNLQWLARKGRIDLTGYDLSDPVDREFLYKKHCALAQSDWGIIGRLMGVSPEEVDAAAETFRGDGEG